MPASFTRRFLASAVLFAASAASHAAEITVSAAASLTDAFKEIAQGYEAAHPGSKVLLNFAASGALLQQMAKGAPVDVFASADQETMDAAVSQKLVAPRERVNFVRNTLVLVVPADSILAIKHLDDLRQAKVARLAVGNPASVPAGRYTQDALEAAKLWAPLTPKMIMTQNVRQALDYVARGETEAGFVYGSDAVAFKGRVKVAMEVPLATPISYPIAATAGAQDALEARRFVAWVQAPAAQAVLARYGFMKP